MRFSPQLRDLHWLVERPIAHRGLHDTSRMENSQSAFAAAIKHNYAIECDLQLSKDGEAMVMHDEALDRVMDHEGWLKNFTVHELKAMVYKFGKDRMQTLGELLEQVNGRVTLVIELKSEFKGELGLVRRAIEVLESYLGPYCLMSFDPEMIAAVAEISPTTVRGITADRVIDPYYQPLSFERRLALREFSHLPETRPHFVSFNFKELPFQPVSQIHAAGHPVIGWTIRSAAEAAQARRYSDQITFEGFLPE